MTLVQWIKHTLVPGSAHAEARFQAACAITDEVTEAVRSRKYPDPFSPIIEDMQRHRAVSEYDQMEAADIYETKVPR